VARRGVFERSFDSGYCFCVRADGHCAGGSRFGFLFCLFSASYFNTLHSQVALLLPSDDARLASTTTTSR
jgi:hypothetical protein